jgi:peptidoglycan LD-endopeptidase CwlK
MYQLGRESKAELSGVHPDLVRLVQDAISISDVDFSVHDGLRTLEEQRRYKAAGASHTMRSRHLLQSDGYAHAVDLVPYINGKLRWELGACVEIARSMRSVAAGIGIIWGGAWVRLDNTGRTNPLDLVDAYISRRRTEGKRPFVDAAHFELA